MPLRSVMMKRFILGFQRRVWCPKWTPLSRSWRMVTTAMPCLLCVVVSFVGARVDGDLPGACNAPHRHTAGLLWCAPRSEDDLVTRRKTREFGPMHSGHTEPRPMLRGALRAWEIRFWLAGTGFEALEEVDVLREVPVAEIAVHHPRPGPRAEHAGVLLVGQGRLQVPGEGLEVLGVVDEQTTLAVHDLVLDAAHGRGDHGPGLPHRLGHGQPEPLDQAFLDHDRGSPLEAVHEVRVLVDVVHRQTGQVRSGACRGGQRLPQAVALPQDLGALGVVA